MLLEKYEDRLDKLRATLKEKDFKLTEVTCQLTTAELKMKLLEEQIDIFEKDLKRMNDGSSSDNLSDAIEVNITFSYNDSLLRIAGEKCCNKGEE